MIESGDYQKLTFIEVMACPSGCIAGGGQPKVRGQQEANIRANSLTKISNAINKPTSNNNAEIKKLYKEYLGEPNGEKAHSLLHTYFTEQSLND